MYKLWAKDWWAGKGPLRGIADWMNRVARWQNHFTVEPPLIADPNHRSLRVWLDTSEVVSSHLWKITVDAAADEFTVGAGWVYDGSKILDKAEQTFPLETADVWLKVKYYNDPETAAELTFVVSDEEPEVSYSLDTVTGDQHTEAGIEWAGWCEYLFKIGSVNETTKAAENYHFSGINQPWGLTVSRKVQTNTRYVAATETTGTFYVTHVTEIYVGGVLNSVSDPEDTALFSAGGCPE